MRALLGGLAALAAALAPAPALGAPDPGGSSTAPLVRSGPEARAFGFNHPIGRPVPEAVALVRLVGGDRIRFGADWSRRQRSPSAPPKWDPLLREFYEAFSGPGERLIIPIVGAPRWAQGACPILDVVCESARQNSGKSPPSPEHLGAYAAAVRDLAERFPRAEIETWNEPNLGGYWQAEPLDPEHMARMQCAAYDAVKSVHPAQAVHAPGLGTLVRDRGGVDPREHGMAFDRYLERMYAVMAPRVCWDVLSLHVYDTGATDGDGTVFAEVFSRLRSVRARHRDRSPVLISEVGAPTGGADDGRRVDEATQRDVLARQVAKLGTQPEVRGVLVHTLFDMPDRGTDDHEAHFGLLRADLSPKPAWCHFAAHAYASYPGCPPPPPRPAAATAGTAKRTPARGKATRCRTARRTATGRRTTKKKSTGRRTTNKKSTGRRTTRKKSAGRRTTKNTSRRTTRKKTGRRTARCRSAGRTSTRSSASRPRARRSVVCTKGRRGQTGSRWVVCRPRAKRSASASTRSVTPSRKSA